MVEPEREESLRLAGKLVNKIVDEIELNYGVKDKQDALSMCALQLASKREIIKKNDRKTDGEVSDKIKKLIRDIDEII